jgi:phosphate starvation-inducible protein PhoH
MSRGYSAEQFFEEEHLDYNLPHNIFKDRVKGKKKQKPNLSLKIKDIEPRTNTQQLVFDSYYSGQNMLLHGMAGTGKTFVSTYLALNDILSKQTDKEKLVILRSVVPTRDMGFLPGNQAEKQKVYEAPYSAICSELFGRGDAYQILKSRDLIEFTSTSFIRGITINNAIVIVDECQNMTFHELDSVITRMGENVQLIFSGDFRQSDFKWKDEREGILDFIKIINNMDFFDSIEFYANDIVRSPMVKQYIIERANHGLM